MQGLNPHKQDKQACPVPCMRRIFTVAACDGMEESMSLQWMPYLQKRT